MSWSRTAREAGLAIIVALGVLLFLDFNGSSALRTLETSSLDLRFRLRGAEAPGNDLAVILVDEQSLTVLGRWPLSRDLFAKAVQTLDQDGAKLVVFDLLFAEPDQPISATIRSAAQAAAAGLPAGQDSTLRSALQQLAQLDPDGDFAAAIKASGKVLLAVAFDFSGKVGHEAPFMAGSVYQQLDDSKIEPVFPLQPQSALPPLAVLGTAADGLGHVSIAYDDDGAPRYEYLALPFDGDFMPSMPVRAAAEYLGVPWKNVGLALGDGIHIDKIRVPTDQAMRLVVNYLGPRHTFPTYSFVDLVDGKIPASELKGRAVLVGASFIGIADTNPSPFGNTPMPGTERMADVIASILHQNFIRDDPPPWPTIVIGLVVLLAALNGIAISLLPTRTAVVAGTVPILGWCGGAQLAFERGLWLPLVNPVIALAAMTLCLLLYRYGFVDYQRRRIQSAFRHYLAPDLVTALAAHPERLQLGGETRVLTLLFSDIRGFTSIAEQFKTNPHGLSQLINKGFLSPMTSLIMARKGTIDKYMGDCIMAFWNAPLDDALHAGRACESALAMVGALDRINTDLAAEAERDGRLFLRLNIGIGLNTGECVVGNMGSDERFAYTAIGDAVNLASRLEGQTKAYHVPIILGEATRQAAPDWAALELDLIAVVGKVEPVHIYALIGDAARARSPEFVAHVEDHDHMLACYRARDWEGARAALAACRSRDQALDQFYELYEQRLDRYAANPPDADWAGVFVAESK